MPSTSNTNMGAFIPTSFVWDISRLQEVEVTSEEFKELLVRLYQNINNMQNVLNIKDSGIYNTLQFVNGQKFFPNPALNSSTPGTPQFRQAYRLLVNFGALPNTGTKSVPHGIVTRTITTFTRIYATASDTTGETYIPIPYASPTLANNIEISVNNTDVTIITGSNRSNYNVCYVVLEYLQS